MRYAYPAPWFLPPPVMYDPNRLVPYSVFGQEPGAPAAAPKEMIGWATGSAPTPAPADTTVTVETDSVLGALKKITPTLLIVGVATGAAFALGGGLVSHFLFPRGR